MLYKKPSQETEAALGSFQNSLYLTTVVSKNRSLMVWAKTYPLQELRRVYRSCSVKSQQGRVRVHYFPYCVHRYS